MPTFVMSLSWTDQGIKSIKEFPKRAKASRELAKKCGVEVKHAYVTQGEGDVLVIVEAPSGDNVAKFAIAESMAGNTRTRSARAWTEAEAAKLISELP